MARSQLEEAVTLCREVNDQYGIALALVHLAAVFCRKGSMTKHVPWQRRLWCFPGRGVIPGALYALSGF